MKILKSFLTIAFVMCMMICIVPNSTYATEWTPPDETPLLYTSAHLDVDLDLIAGVGHQASDGEACSCYALAYARTITDSKVHHFSEYNQYGNTEYTVNAVWENGGYYGVGYPTKQEALFFIYKDLQNGKPVIAQVSGTRSTQHFVTIVGFENVTSFETLSEENLLIIDPVPSSEFQIENMKDAGYGIKYYIDESDNHYSLARAYNYVPTVDFSFSVPSECGQYLSECTYYPSYGTATVTKDCTAKSMPCTDSVNASSEELYSLSVGNSVEVTGLYKNTKDNYWYRVKCDGVTCYLYAGNASFTAGGTVTISGVSAPQTIQQGSSYSIEGKITADIYTVTSIGDYAFWGSSSMHTVSIPNGITSIGEYAFYSSGITSVTLPSSVITLKPWAFGCCYNLVSVELYEGLLTIEDYAFADCECLKSVSIPETVTAIGSRAFFAVTIEEFTCYLNGYVTVPFGVKTLTITGGDISDCAFKGYTNLTTVNILSCGNTIGREAFFGCTSLKSISIPSNVTSICAYAFAYCNSLKSIDLPDGLTSIGNWAFGECTGLRSIALTPCLASMGANTFLGCTSLETVELPYGITIIEWGSFSGCTSLKSVTFPSSVTEIWYQAFSGCTALESVTIPLSVKVICGDAFSDCMSFKNVYFEGTYCQWNAIDKVDTAFGEVQINTISEHSFADWQTVVYPTCTENGTKTRVCSLCGAEESNAVAAFGHNYTFVKRDADCTVDGYTAHICLKCDDIQILSSTLAYGHIWGDWISGLLPTSTNDGYEHRSCENCGEAQTQTLRKKNGDMNGDGLVSNSDITVVVRCLAGWVCDYEIHVADVNCDNKVTNRDVIAIIQKVAGWDE